MRRSAPAAVLVTLLVLLSGCGDHESPTEPRPDPSGPVAFEALYASKFSALPTRGGEVITDAGRWARVWQDLHGDDPVPPLPAIDFSRDMVIVAATGYNPDSCFSATITGVERAGQRLVVSVADERLPPSCSCPPIPVQPADAVKTRRIEIPATFEFRRVTSGNNC